MKWVTMSYFQFINTTRLDEDRIISQALKIINDRIEHGSLVYLCEKDRKDFSIKLKHPIEIVSADFTEVGEIVG